MNKSLFLLLFFLLTFMCPGLDVRAQKAPTVPSGSAILYKITGKKLKKPSYIFGTIHLICPKDMFPAEGLKAYVGQTEQLLLELDLDDPAVMKKAASGSMMPDGKSVKPFLKPEEYAKVDALFKNYLGISYDQLQNFKPILVTAVLLRSPKVIGCSGPVAYDNFLVEIATAKKMPINGLETVEAEFAALDAQPIEKQVEGLVKMASDPEKGFGEFKDLYRIYLTQSSDDLFKLTENQEDMDAAMQEKLLVDRNAAWIPVIEKNITSTPSFLGVGSAHLGGPKGVLNLLRKKGYVLTPIKL